MKWRKGQMGLSLFLVGAVVIVAAVMLSGVGATTFDILDQIAFNRVDVVNEKHNNTDTLPTLITVDQASDTYFEGVVVGSETIVYQDTSALTNTTLSKSNYTANYDAGEFNITDVTGYSPTGDVFWVDYTWLDGDTPVSDIVASGNSTLKQLASSTRMIIAIILLFLVVAVVRVFGFSVGGGGGSLGV